MAKRVSPSAAPSMGSLVPFSFNNDEAEIFQRLISTTDSPNQLIPADVDANELWRYLQVTTKLLVKSQQAVGRLKAFLGRILLLIKNYPHLYEQQGFKTYDEFMSVGVAKLFGVHRAEAYNCARIASVLGFMPAEDLEQMSSAKLNVLATAIQRDTDATMPIEMVAEKCDEWVQAARTLTVQEMKERLEDKQLIESGETDRVSLVISVTPAAKALWTEATKSPEVRAYVASDDPGQIFDRAIQEFVGEATAQGAAMLQAR